MDIIHHQESLADITVSKTIYFESLFQKSLDMYPLLGRNTKVKSNLFIQSIYSVLQIDKFLFET